MNAPFRRIDPALAQPLELPALSPREAGDWRRLARNRANPQFQTGIGRIVLALADSATLAAWEGTPHLLARCILRGDGCIEGGACFEHCAGDVEKSVGY